MEFSEKRNESDNIESAQYSRKKIKESKKKPKKQKKVKNIGGRKKETNKRKRKRMSSNCTMGVTCFSGSCVNGTCVCLDLWQPPGLCALDYTYTKETWYLAVNGVLAAVYWSLLTMSVLMMVDALRKRGDNKKLFSSGNLFNVKNFTLLALIIWSLSDYFRSFYPFFFSCSSNRNLSFSCRTFKKKLLM